MRAMFATMHLTYSKALQALPCEPRQISLVAPALVFRKIRSGIVILFYELLPNLDTDFERGLGDSRSEPDQNIGRWRSHCRDCCLENANAKAAPAGVCDRHFIAAGCRKNHGQAISCQYRTDPPRLSRYDGIGSRVGAIGRIERDVAAVCLAEPDGFGGQGACFRESPSILRYPRRVIGNVFAEI